MFSPFTVLLADLVYIALLFGVALWVERGGRYGRRVAGSPLVYSLSLAVYCTAWTYYGSVGKAVTSGFLFLTIYLGPTLAIILWWFLLRRMIRIKNRYRVTSIADFISVRYGKSQAVAAMITLSALVGAMPYIAIQIKAINTTFQVITTPAGPAGQWLYDNAGLVTVALMCVFTIVFGVRRLDPTERHEGMVTAVALESVVKLVAFLAVGIFVTYGLYDGFDGLFSEVDVSTLPVSRILSLSGGESADYVLWATYLLLAMSAIMFLPRQFHVAVVENADERHLRTSIWLFPLYMLLINLFVAPIAIVGLAQGLPASWADTFVLRVPLSQGRHWLSLLAFLGGFSAAMSMVMIAAMTMSTMLTNHLLLPVVAAIGSLGILRRHLLRCRWVAVVVVIGIGFWFERTLGTSYALVNMGMMSFAAALQFAPALLIGLYWRGASKTGALLGHGAGIGIWFYTLLLPAFAKSGWLSMSLVESGPWGLAFLRPEALFGLSGLDPLTHTVFWSMLGNCGLLVLGSLLCRTSDEEKALALEFMDVLQGEGAVRGHASGAPTIALQSRLSALERLLGEYFSEQQAAQTVQLCIARAGLENSPRICVMELAALCSEAEKILAGAIGSAAAHKAFAKAGIFTQAETKTLSQQFADILAELRLSPEELKQMVDYHKEREILLARHAAELEKEVELRTRDLALKAKDLEQANVRLQEMDKMKSAFLSSVSHELRTPLTSVLGFAKLIEKSFQSAFLPLAQDRKTRQKGERLCDNLRIIIHEGERLTRLINDVLDLTRIEDGRATWNDASFPVRRLLDRAVNAIMALFAEKPAVRLRLEAPDDLPDLVGDIDQLQQVLLNLLNNACKFTEHGEVTLSASTAPDGGVVFAVRDTGVGIAPDDLTLVFDKFYQVTHGDTLSDKPKGSGLGLAICRQITEHYHGRIWAESEPGTGSTFFVHLPPTMVEQREKALEEKKRIEEAARDQAARSRGRVLVVDDDPAVCSYISQLLEQENYLVATAANGREALDVAHALKPDLITMDLMMPVMDGQLAIAALREDPELSAVPIVIISALQDRFRVSGDANFCKPINEERLLQAIHMLLNKSRQACDYSILVKGDAELPLSSQLLLCPGGIRTVTPEGLWEAVELGMHGTVIIPPGLCGAVDMERLAREENIQIVILPE